MVGMRVKLLVFLHVLIRNLKNVKIRISLSSLDGLTVGQTVSLSIEEAKPEVGVLAPVSAVLFDEDEAYVLPINKVF